VTFTDDDLRAALSGLAGDPSRDALRVVAGLSAVRTGARRPVIAWLALAAALGLGAGWFLHTNRSEPSLPVEPPSAPVVAPAGETAIRLRCLQGKVLDTTETVPAALAAGDTLPFDRTIATLEDGLAFLALEGDVAIRMNRATRLHVAGRGALALQEGELWLRAPEDGGRVVVETFHGVLTARGGTFHLKAGTAQTTAAALAGEAEFVGNTGEHARLAAGSRCTSEGGSVGAVEPVKDAWSLVAWQVRPLAECVDFEEAVELVSPWVDRLGDPQLAEVAAHELRRTGEVGAAALGMVLWDARSVPAEHLRRIAALLEDLAGPSTVRYAMQGLLAEDPEVRVLAHATVQRVTGLSERDAEFWRRATAAERFDAVLRLRRRLQDF